MALLRASGKMEANLGTSASQSYEVKNYVLIGAPPRLCDELAHLMYVLFCRDKSSPFVKSSPIALAVAFQGYC